MLLKRTEDFSLLSGFRKETKHEEIKREICIEKQRQGFVCISCHSTVYKGKSLRLRVMTVLLDDKIALSTKGLSI